MLYLSKGILPWKASPETASVSHCGVLHKLSGGQAALWLVGRFAPGRAEDARQETALAVLSELGIVECNDDDHEAALFRILINCVICPVRVKVKFALLNRTERFLWRWIRHAGLRLTMAELTLLLERGIEPVPELLGETNRQALTEVLYTTDTISDGILETLTEKSPARDEAVGAVLGLLRKKKLYLI
jgi:hypothetical protein